VTPAAFVETIEAWRALLRAGKLDELDRAMLGAWVDALREEERRERLAAEAAEAAAVRSDPPDLPRLASERAALSQKARAAVAELAPSAFKG
jgi:hypothetical protein